MWSLRHRVELDPDQRIQEAMRLVFQQFRATGSVRQTLPWFRQERIELPAVEYGRFGRGVVWKLPAYNGVHHILTNPIYAGAYAFGRTRTQTTVVGGRARKRDGVTVPRDEWAVLLQAHYDGYIEWQEHETIQRQIAENAYVEGRMTRGAPREGAALLAGLLRCRRCGRRLHVADSGVGATVRRYSCQGAHVNHGADASITECERCISLILGVFPHRQQTVIPGYHAPRTFDSVIALFLDAEGKNRVEQEVMN